MAVRQCGFTPAACDELHRVKEAQGRLEERVKTLESSYAKIEKRLDRFLWCLLGIMGTSTGGLLLALFNRSSASAHP